LASTSQDEQRLALFIDFENIAIGVRDAHYRKFDVNLVLERLLDKGKLLVKRAYADWSRYSDYKRSFHEAAIELIEVPQKSVGGKNSADIRLVVDAMDLAFQKEHINCFVVASGDSDFSPLVSKLKENNKYVIGLGVKDSTSDLLMENCDEFIFYEDIVRVQQRPLPPISNAPGKLQECFALLVDSILALQRENKENLWGSMVKETMKRKKPSFNESYYGFRTFSHLLEDAQRRGIVVLRRDQRSGSYVVEDLGTDGVATASASRPAEAAPAVTAAAAPPMAEGGEAATNGSAAARPSRRRRGRGRRGRGMVAASTSGAAPSEAELEGEGELEEGDETEDTGGEADAQAAPAEKHDTPTSDPPSASAAEQDRGPFSFISWLRRSQAEKADEAPASPRPPSEEPPDHRDK
jgi:uncharacterized protein (TIGR00288 family)